MTEIETSAMEVMRLRVPRKRLPIGSPRVYAHGIAANNLGFMSKRVLFLVEILQQS